MKKLEQRILFIYFLMFLSFVLTYTSILVIYNPDLENYQEMMLITDFAALNVELVFKIITILSNRLISFFPFSTTSLVYFIHIFSILCLNSLSIYILNNKKLLSTFIGIFLWLLMYGTLHCLIQIRFGMGAAFIAWILAVSLVKQENKLITRLGILAPLIHFSMIFPGFIITLLGRKISIISNNKIYLIHLTYILVLLSFKLGLIFNFLPGFLQGKIGIYLFGEDAVMDFKTTYASIILYVVLMFSKTKEQNLAGTLRLFGCLSFIPYFICPEIEILVRTGIPFQYLFISYLFMTFAKKKYFLTSTLPLIGFIMFKIYSNISAFNNYLQ